MDFFREAALKKAQEKEEPTKKHVIMIVDDEEHNLSALSALLRNEYEIITAISGIKGLELIKNDPDPSRIHLIISDQRMPKLSGVEFLQQTIEFIPKTKRILLTGYSDVDSIIDSINKSQIHRFVLKPFEPVEMIDIVRRALETYDLETRNDRLVEQLQKTLGEQQLLMQASNRFVPHDLLQLLKKESITELQLGDHIIKDMAVMFSDIRGFTSLSEQITARQSFAYINTYFSRMGPIIRKHGGFIVKYLGDGMMAVFPQGVKEAIEAGIEKLQAIHQLNQEFKLSQQPTISAGIGVNIGSMMLGIVGEANRIQGDVLADAVNLTERLEGLTKYYGVSFLITEKALQELSSPGDYRFRSLGKVQVKGKQKPTSIYEIFDGDLSEQIVAKEKTKDLFEKGIQHFQEGDFQACIPFFESVLQENAKDHAAQYQLQRAETFLAQGNPLQWPGFDTVDIK